MFAFKLALLVASLKVKYSFDFGPLKNEVRRAYLNMKQKYIKNGSLFLNKVYSTCKLYSVDTAHAVTDHCLRDRHVSDVLAHVFSFHSPLTTENIS